MGEIREEVESFYMRDYVEEKVTIMVINRMSSVNLMLNCRWRRDSLSNSASPTWYKNFSTLFVHLEKNISSIKTKCNTMLMEIMLMIALACVATSGEHLFQIYRRLIGRPYITLIYCTHSAGQNILQYIECTREAQIRP